MTDLLVAWSNGDHSALDKLIPLVEAELHDLAQRYLRREHAGHTLQTTALVNEAYLRLVDYRHMKWQNRAHFFAVSAQIMRRILIEQARGRRSLKRGGLRQRVSLDEAISIPLDRPVDLIALDDALKSLADFDARKHRVVELRFFGGLSVDETAEVLKVSRLTVLRDWRMAKAWLYRELNRKGEDGS